MRADAVSGTRRRRSIGERWRSSNPVWRPTTRTSRSRGETSRFCSRNGRNWAARPSSDQPTKGHPMKLAGNSNEDFEAHGFTQNTNENADVDERGRLSNNDNEDTADDDVEAHGIRENTNEGVEADERGRLAGNDNEDAADDQ